ncbi:uncharacterized protein [Nicotiana tomentosiformis]|uniref:uncharacterized protein n=1 Tax=Nicotiana tomentosiformis TaxID=4098 RepID=UPI00388C4F5D
MGRGRGRGRASSSSGPQNCIYVLAGRQDQESSPNVVTCILSVSSYDVYALIDPGTTLSYVTLLVVSKFGIEPELIKPVEVSTPFGDPVIARRIKDGSVPFPREPVFKWKGNTASLRGRFISYLKARKVIKKGYIYHLVRVQDVKVESPTVQSIPVINEFSDIFPDELPGLSPEREIEFGVDILPDTQSISIPLYRMALVEPT